MEDDSLKQLIWDRRCDASPKCQSCGRSVYQFDTYTQIGVFLFCERCIDRSHRLCSADLEL